MEHWNMCALSHILTGQIPVSVKTISAFVGQFSPMAQRFFPICYPPCQHSGGFLLSKCYSRHLVYWQMRFPAVSVLPSAVFLSISFPQKIKRLYTNNSYSRSGLICGDESENWSSCISSVTSTLMKICSVPASNETWKDKKNYRYSLELAFRFWMITNAVPMLMVTVGSVEFSRTSQLCQLVSQGFSLCYQLRAEKKNTLGEENDLLFSLSLVWNTSSSTCYYSSPGNRKQGHFFMSYGTGIGKILLCIIRDRQEGVIDHDDLKIHRENGGWI